MRIKRLSSVLLSILLVTSLISLPLLVSIAVTSVGTVKASTDTIFSDDFSAATDISSRYDSWFGGTNLGENELKWQALSNGTGGPKQGLGRLGLFESGTALNPWISTSSFATTGYENIKISFGWAMELNQPRSGNFWAQWSTDNINWVNIAGTVFNDTMATPTVITNVSVSSNDNVANKPALWIRWWADNSTGTGGRDKVSFDNVVITGTSKYFEKTCMPDLGQHSVNWCWVAAAANSLYWYSQHGYLQLIDDPANPIENDNTYITQMILAPDGHFVYRLFFEIASDCGHVWNEGVYDNEYFYGLQKFINDQGAPLIVHEIVDPAYVLQLQAPPADGIKVIYRPPTLMDYEMELENCQDVLLWLDYKYENYPYYEDTDHVVTGFAFNDNNWILVSDPWTTGAPDHNNGLENKKYDNLTVLSTPDAPLHVRYNNTIVYVPKIVFISPGAAPQVTYGVDVSIAPSSQVGLAGTTLNYTVTVTNTGNVMDTYNLTVSDSAIPSWGPSVLPVTLPNVPAGGNGTATLSVTIPPGTASGAIDNITVTSTGTGVSDNDSCLAQVAEYFIKENMPDLGQHSRNWCWTAAAANSFKWYFHNGYPKLVDDPRDNVLDENYLQLFPCPSGLGDLLPRLLYEIAVDCLYPNVSQENENTISLAMTYCRPIDDNRFFYGLQKFIREQGGQFKVREILDNSYFAGLENIPPENDNVVIYDPPTFDNYKSELKQCHDVLLQINFNNYDYENGNLEALGHIVTGVAYYDGGAGNQWILVSDPWTPLPGPDHNSNENLIVGRYENLQVTSTDPLTVVYTGWTPGGPITLPVQVVKLILISPSAPTTPCTGTASIRLATGNPPAAPFLWGIRKVKTTENLVVNQGDNLRLKFLAQDNVTVENEAVIWSRTAPGAQTVNLTNLIVPHDNNLPYPLFNVKRVKLVLTDSAGNIILDNMTWYRVVQDDWGSRVGWIVLNWAAHNSSQQDQLGAEISQIILNWAATPTATDQHDFSQS